MQWIGAGIFRIILFRLDTQCLVELELYYEAHVVSDIFDICNHMVLWAGIEIFLRPVHWWFDALILFRKSPPCKKLIDMLLHFVFNF